LSKIKGEYGMSDNKVQDLMKKHPPWFTLDIHSIRFSKRLSEEEQKGENEVEANKDKE